MISRRGFLRGAAGLAIAAPVALTADAGLQRAMEDSAKMASPLPATGSVASSIVRPITAAEFREIAAAGLNAHFAEEFDGDKMAVPNWEAMYL
jgi:hypothetical protein